MNLHLPNSGNDDFDDDDVMPEGLADMLEGIAGQPAGDFEKPAYVAPVHEHNAETVPVFFLTFVTHEQMLKTFVYN